MTQRPLFVEVNQGDDGAVVVTCGGEIDLHTVEELRAAIAWAMSVQPALLRIDLTEVGFIDSSGLACLVDLASACRRHRTLMQILPSPRVRRLFELTGVDILVGGAMPPASRRRGFAFTEPDALGQHAESTDAAVLAHKHQPTDDTRSSTG
jgi:anti-sigma B factor antagonist